MNSAPAIPPVPAASPALSAAAPAVDVDVSPAGTAPPPAPPTRRAARRTGVGQLRAWLIAATAVCLVLDVGLWSYLSSPWGPSRARAQERLAAAARADAALHGQIAGLLALRRDLASSRAETRDLLARGMPPQRVADFQILTTLQRLAQETGVSADSIGLRPAREPLGDLQPLEVDAQVTGQYPALVQFINGVERSPLFFVINQVALTSNDRAANQGGGALSLKIALSAYARLSAGEAVRPASAPPFRGAAPGPARAEGGRP